MCLQSGCEIPNGGLWSLLSEGDDRNRSFTLPGREQTNNHAELLAASAMRVQDGNFDVRSYIEYVVRVVTGLLQGQRHLNNEGNAG